MPRIVRTALEHPYLAWLLTTAVAVGAVVGIAEAAQLDEVGRAFDVVVPGWLVVALAAEVVSLPGYVAAYRTIVARHGGLTLPARTAAGLVVGGFGPFAVLGGFDLDRRGLPRLGAGRQETTDSVLALGALEWAVLGPVVCAAAIEQLVVGSRAQGSVLWPWAIAVPAGAAGVALATVVARRRRDRAASPWAMRLLAAVAVIVRLAREPIHFAPAWLGAALYWAADLASLYAALRAFGLHLGPERLLVAYASGYALTRRTLPLGGAGIVEVLMPYALYWVGEPLAASLAAVVTYRAANLTLLAALSMVARYELWPRMTRGDDA